MSNHLPIEIAVKVLSTTIRAILVDHGGKEPAWIPKSVVSDWTNGPDDEPGYGTTSIFLPEWLAKDKGIL